MGDTYDPLGLGRKRVRGCAQCFRRLGRGEIELRDLERTLAATTGCGGRGCDVCGDAVLRLASYVGDSGDYTRAFELATWAKSYVTPLTADLRLRAAGLVAFFQRFTDPAAAEGELAATSPLLGIVSPGELAHHLARSAVVRTESLLFDEARDTVERSRSLYRDARPSDPERGPAWVAVADTYVEIGAAFADVEAYFAAPLERALASLGEISEDRAPRTYHALAINVLGLLVSAWRCGADVDAAGVLFLIEESFDFRSRRSDPAATSMRWLWILVAAEIEGLSQRVRNRLRHTRTGLVAQRRWRDLVDLELDVLWIACYFRHPASRSHLLSQAKNLRRALVDGGYDVSPLEDFTAAVEMEGCVPRERLASLFELRGIRHTQVRDVPLR